MPAPEIGATGMVAGGIAGLVLGIIVGTQAPWWVELILLLSVVVVCSSWFIQALEIGAIVYFFIGFAFVVGMLIGDVSWWFQVGMPTSFFENIPNPFKVH